jgi:hypothetical protein
MVAKTGSPKLARLVVKTRVYSLTCENPSGNSKFMLLKLFFLTEVLVFLVL